MVYKRLNWAKEPVSSQKLNDMVGNDDFLFEKMITGYYNVAGIVRDSGLEIRTGFVKGIATQANSFWASHYYPKPFLPGARPVILCAVASASAMLYVLGTRGLDGRAIADHRGFLCHFSQLRPAGHPTKFYGEQWAAYVAIAPRA